MSKVVKGVFRAVSKVVSGVVKAVKKVAKSPIGKIILAAATIYFGGAAIMGAMGAPAGSGIMGALQGAGAGISNAWTSLLQAGSSALGGNFAQAGSQLSAGFQGTTMAAGSTAAAAAPAASAAGSGITLGGPAPQYGANALLNPSGAVTSGGAAIPAAAAPTAAKTAGFWGTNAGAATVLAGGQLAGGLIQGVGAQKEAERQEQLQAEVRARYNRNVGTPLWGNQESTGYTGESTTNPLIYQRPDYQVAGGPSLLQQGQGLVGGNMNPVFGYAGFPVFNPRTNY
jgi:hypothetical protein